MSDDIERFRRELAELGARIDAKIKELHEQGVLHGRARQKAAELQIQHARLSRVASADHFTVGGAISDELAIDAEILRHTFERWMAHVDASEQ